MFKNLYLDAPNIGKLEKQYLSKAIDTGYVSTIGPYVSEFEEEFAKYLKIKNTVSTQSGTAALHVSLHELGIGKGDEVIAPVLTFVATVNPVVYVGAKPVFVDVDIDTWTIDPCEIEKCITKKTKAIIPVHLYGNPCNMERINAIAKKHKLYVIEDATESLGATYKAKPCGTFGDFGCFSFNGNKIITTGGGGMVAGKNDKKMKHIKFLVNQARDDAQGYYHPEIGFNYRMTNIEAAIGLAQLKRVNDFIAKKRKIHSIYQNELGNIEQIDFQKETKDAKSSWWLTCFTVNDKSDMLKLKNKLKDEGVPARRVFMPVADFPFYKKYKKENYENSYAIYENGICLPSSTLNCEKDIHNVCKIIKRFFKK
ncbi:MAG: LegC family aminotransferase [Candidatus Omnitrophica bacterium]|nr:LegC family aminotransferase [Candidatus Omnitrophota bacterium]